ncbi:MAG TPA: DNA-processing protein DprA [Polyangiaceae bacterium]|jgi:DNA processing protein|nr:DNA-processing protein DprA [Polyangiaceae bacterium]
MSGTVETCLTGASLPARLADLRRPPTKLFLRGELARGPQVAIVGMRSPSERGAKYAHKLAGELAAAGVVVISGGAEGIDTAAHRGALDAGGATVVVAPAGFERPFPKENALIFQEVLDRGGAYLSLVEGDVPATRSAFFPRNAVLVALAHVVVVVESCCRGGARNAAAYARRLGRPLFAVPYPPWHKKGRGCVAELLLGARPLRGAKDLLKALAAQNLHAVSTAAELSRARQPQQEILNFTAVSTPEAARVAVLDAVRRGAASADEICLRTGLSAGRVSELILTLRLEGVLVTHPSGCLQIGKFLI